MKNLLKKFNNARKKRNDTRNDNKNIRIQHKKMSFNKYNLPHGTYIFKFKGINKHAVGYNESYDGATALSSIDNYTQFIIKTENDDYFTYTFKIVKCIDGDTFICEFDGCTHSADVDLSNSNTLFDIFTLDFKVLPPSCILMDQVNSVG